MRPDLRKDLNLFIIDFANIPITLIGNDYHYRLVNNCFCLAHGKQKDELIGKSVEEVWGKEVFETAVKAKLDLCFAGQAIHDEAWMYLPARGRRYCEVVYSPYVDGRGAVSHAVVITYDITERKRMEEALSESEQRFRKLSEASLEAIVFIHDGVIVDGNSALNHLFRYEGEELVGKPITGFVAPEERIAVNERMWIQIEGRYETIGLRKDGTTFPIEINVRQFKADGYDLSVSAIRDLTERKKTDQQLKAYQEHLEHLVEERTEELRASEEKFRNIFLNATEGIFQLTPEGRPLSVNPAFARIHGFDSAEEVTQEVENIGKLHVDPQRREEYLKLLYSKRRVHNFECSVYRKDGTTTWVSVNARVVFDETGQALYHEGTVQDVYERKRMEEQLLLQRDLALELGQVSSIEVALHLCLDVAIKASGMECGGIYVQNPATGYLEVVCSRGLPETFEKKIAVVAPDSSAHALAMAGKPIYVNLPANPDFPFVKELLAEGFLSLGAIPVVHKGTLVACFNLVSRFLNNVPHYARATLELIAMQLGLIAVRIQAQEALQAKSRSLEEMNTALKVLLNQREADKSELEESVLANVRQLVLPYTGKLRESRLNEIQNSLLDVAEGNLNSIISPFLKRVRVFNFTPKELEVITLIKEGKTTKDIAAILQVGISAIDVHRYNIRKKLGLNQLSKNLRSHLLSLE